MRFFFSPFPYKTSLPTAISRSLSPFLADSAHSRRFHPPRGGFFCTDPTRSPSPPQPPPPRCTSMADAAPKAPIGTVNCEEGIAKRLWIKFRRESLLAMYTPFVVCLASGTLELASFRHYISQDVHFLKSFAQAYQLAEDCADDDDAKAAISELRKSVLDELTMHDSFAKEWDTGFTEGTLSSGTVKYRDFLLATASGKVEGVKGPIKLATPFEKTKIAAYTLAAMTPCMRLYAFLAKEFLSLLDHTEDDHPYKKWIDTYASEDFQASALQIEDLLDKLSVSLTGEELDVIEKLYHRALKLETEFFCAQPLAQQTIVPLVKEHSLVKERLVVFSDFDLTCNIVDSSAVLAEIAIVTAPKSDQSHHENPVGRIPSAALRNTWAVLSTQYTEEYEQCIESIVQTEKSDKFNYEDLRKALQKLSEFEKRANCRVIDSGVLKGLNLEDIKRAGGRMIFQDGCTAFFQNLVKSEHLNPDVHVLSYCWCGDLIRSAFLAGGLNALKIHANDFTYEESISTGEIVKNVETPIDKVEAFSTIIKDCSDDRRNLTVYIGDSVGDLLCLLEADVGIVVGSSSSLRKVGGRFGVSFVPLYRGLVKMEKECLGQSKWKGLSGVLYTVSGWAEIQAFILGCSMKGS